MQQTLCQFVEMLRKAQIPVSTAELLECLKSLSLPAIDIYNVEQFKTILQAHFIKTPKYQERFEQCFKLFFHQHSKAQLPFSQNSASEQTSIFLEQQLSLEENTPSALKTDLVDFLTGENSNFIAQIEQVRQGRLELPSSNDNMPTGFLVLGRRLEILRTLQTTREQLEGFFTEQLDQFPSIADQNALRAERNLQRTQLQQLEEMLLSNQSSQQLQNTRTQQIIENQEQLNNKSLFALTNPEQEKVFELMAQLIRKINDARSLRWRKKRRGHLNIHKTLRYNMRFGGVPIQLHHVQHPRHKGSLCILCDISGSVYSIAQIMLFLIYAIAQQFDRVQSFAFVSSLAELDTTLPEFNNPKTFEKVQKAATEGGGRTNYGRVLRQFADKQLRHITTRTTVIFLGDARNNGFVHESNKLEKIQQRARRVIWLNPERQDLWNTGDSEARSYQPYCNEFQECRTYAQLESFIKQLSLN